MKVRHMILKTAARLAGGVFALALMLGIQAQAKDVTVNSADQLQQVLDEAKDLTETLNVTIPAGSDFTIGRFLYVYPNTVINAAGATIRNTNPTYALIATPEVAPGNITINGGTWEAGGNSFMDYTAASNVAVNYATIKGSGDYIAVLNNCQNVTFQDCVMSGAGIRIVGGKGNAIKGGSLTGTSNPKIPSIFINGVEGAVVDKVAISGSANTAIRMEDALGAQITKNNIQNAYSIGIESVGGGNHNISDNYLKDSGYMGIRIATDQGSVISGNGLDGNAVREGSNGEGLVVDYSSNGTVVKDNIVKNTKGIADKVGNGIIVNRSTSITVSGNTVSASANHGIQVSYNSREVTVNGNTVTASGNMGISVTRGAQAALKNNEIKSSASRGIVFDGSKEGVVSGSIEGCTVSGSSKEGIYIEAANVSMSGNSIANNGTGGLAITNYSTVTANKNKIYQDTVDENYSGIAVSKGSALTMNDNIISNFKAVGVLGSGDAVVDGSNNQVNLSSGGFKDSNGAYSIRNGMRSNTIYAYSVGRTSASIETNFAGGLTGVVINGKRIEETGDRNITVTYGDTDPAGVIVYTQDEKGNAICMQAPVHFSLKELSVPVPDDVNVEEIRAFVSRLYTVALGREAEEDGLNDWTNRLATGQESGAQVAQGFFFSDEFKNKGMSDSQYIDTLYRTMFAREADQGGKDGWLSDLHNGMSREFVYRGFAESDEFDNLCKSYNINKGQVTLEQPRDQNPKLTEFVSRVYYIALNRNSLDEAGINDWCGRILGGANPSDVVWGIVFSDEFRNRNLSNEDFVRVMYRTYFDREADSDGFNDWMGQLGNGASREHVVNGFSGSEEFANLVKSFGL